jgi:hypothetical protein
MPHDLGRLEAGLKELDELLDSLSREDTIAEVLRHIHQPGWTTPAEFLLVSELVAVMRQQAQTLKGMQHALVAGSREITAAGAVAAGASA